MSNSEDIAKQNFFNRLKQKNNINRSKIEDLDVESIGVLLNYEMIDLLTFVRCNDSIGYNNYINKLLPFKEYRSKDGLRRIHLMVIRDLVNDSKMPIRVRETLKRIYEETISKDIDDDVLMDTLNKLISKLSYDLQRMIYDKLNYSYNISYEGLKDMDYNEASRLYEYINKDFTCITLNDICTYKNYVNYNGTFNKEILDRALKFCYEGDKQVKIRDLISYEDLPLYLLKNEKTVIKQKLIAYVSDISRFIKNFNAINTRIDRKNFIRSIDVFSSLVDGRLLNILSIEDLCDIISVARSNLKDVIFVYNENGLEVNRVRNKYMDILNSIREYENKNNIKLVDEIGIKMHVNLDLLNDDIVKMFDDLKEFNLPISITEFDLYATYDMIVNNTHEQIEILRERFISDLCNLIANFVRDGSIKITSFTIDSLNDKQNHMLTVLNDIRRINGEEIFLTVYGGYYYDNFDRKEGNVKLSLVSTKGGMDILYGLVIIAVLVIVIAVVSHIFVNL